MAPSTLKKTLQLYRAEVQTLEGKLEQLRNKREELGSRAFVMVDEGGREREEHETYQSEVNSLVSTATNILLEVLELKLMYLREGAQKLSTILRENPKLAVPPELSFSRYEEWLETNQRLSELNSQLYELERLKFELRQKHEQARKAIAKGEADRSITGSQFVQSSIHRIQHFMTLFRITTPATTTTQTYIQELLSPRGNKTTLESQKVQEYVTECVQHASEDLSNGRVQGAHPQRYQQFMAVLCGYIVEKQRERQGEELLYELVYSTVERHLMPQIKSAVLRHVAHPDKDKRISQQCARFANVTLDQLRVKPGLQTKEIVPFIGSVTQLRASYFAPNPTDKMYTIVAGAKALYEQLGVMGEMSIDGDSFLDLWIYVILKANVRDLATNLSFMAEYGNPQLANDEAGYYLTTLEAAVTYIERLTPEKMRKPRAPERIIVCERKKFSRLAQLPSSCFEVVTSEEVLRGYKVAVIQKWALNRARLFSSVLVPSGSMEDSVTVSVVRLSLEKSNGAHVQYFTERFTNPGKDMEGLYSCDLPLGTAVLVDLGICDPQNLIVLPSGDFNKHIADIEHVLQLIRLGSQGREDSHDTCVLPPSYKGGTSILSAAPLNKTTTAIATPLNTPNSSMTSLEVSKGRVESSVTTSSPYILDSELEPSYHGSVSSVSRQTPEVPRSHNIHVPQANVEDTLQHQVTVAVEVHSDAIQSSLSSTAAATNFDLSSVPQMFAFSEDRASATATARTGSSGHDGKSTVPDAATHTLSLSPSSQLDPEGSGTFPLSEDSCPIDALLASPQNIFSPAYSRELEANVVQNHLFGDSSQPLRRSMQEIIRQGQMYLQRLNYMSVTHKIDGFYSDAMLHAVKKFQQAHNGFESRYSMVLPENGYLTAATLQYLRQAFLTVYASVLRLGLDRDLGENFNPMSTSEADIQKFRECIEKLQRDSKVTACQGGSLCANTIDKIRHMLRTHRRTI